MADTHKVVAGRHLGLLFEVGTVVGLTDGQLLDRIVADRDEAAFTALIERHGPMVQRVCWGVLGNHHEAQDAFQATFLVLSLHAGSIRRRDSLASWLHGVALRIASCIRSASARRRKHERAWAALRSAEADGVEEAGDRFEPHLHAELGRLPERFRAPVILCYLEGRTYEEAAEVLRCPVGTIKSRLATARQRLRSRLEQLDLAPLLIHPATAPAAIPTQLVAVMIEEVRNNAAGEITTTRVASLAREVLKIMFFKRIGAVVGALVASAVLVTCAVELARAAKGSDAAVEAKAELAVAQPAAGEADQAAAEEPAVKPQAAEGVPMTLAGRVTDEQGRPVTGADVRFRLFRTSLRPLRIAAEAVDAWEVKTDTEGRYKVDGIRWNPGGDYEHMAMDVNAQGFVESIGLHFSDFPHATALKGVFSDIKLRRGVAVTGRCVGPDGKPVAGARIRSGSAQDPLSSLGRARTTDAEGRFRLHIPDGREAELIVYSRGWAPQRVGVAAGGGNLGDIRLEAGVEITGHLRGPRGAFSGASRAEGLTAIASSMRSRPTADRVIALESVEHGRFGWFPITLAFRTDRDGNFRIPALKGRFKIWTAPAHDHGPDDRGPIVSKGLVPAISPRIMDFEPGSSGVHQDLILSTEPEVAIRGKIIQPDGKPARGVCLWLMAAIGKENRLTPLRWTTTDAEGRYALTGIPRGLTGAYLDMFAPLPDGRSSYDAVASGRFQGTNHGRQVIFKPIDQDQDPLDFRLELQDGQPSAVPVALSVEDKALIDLGKEVKRLENDFTNAQCERANHDRELALYREIHPHNRLASRFLELAAAHPDHPVAISALGYVFFAAATGTGDRDAMISKAREQAIDQVIERHLANPNIVFFFTDFMHGVPTLKGETLLRAALARSPHREVRAAACYELARFLQFKAGIPATLRLMEAKPRPDDPFIRQIMDQWQRNVECFRDVDVAKARAEAEQLLERVGRDFADVPQAQFLMEGPGRVQLSRITSPGPETKTYGALAEAALFELRHISVGQPAPDIEGEDIDGQRFRLSDYRGRVVVLTFGRNWCGSCREMYPQERALVARFKDRPFAMLGVNADPDRETLRKSIQKGEITWRNWWDGQDGPIASRWNIQSFPTIFVIDAKGLIREIGLPGANLDWTVNQLLTEMTGSGKD